jgi:signal transduction histidine kinase
VVQPINPQLQPVDLAAWADERLRGARERAAAKHVDLSVHAEPLCAQIDTVHLARAIDNLLDNAVRHAPAQGRVSLTVQRRGTARLVVRVEDDGAGVPGELQAQLFEPFATGRPDGTGLGLALAREVALAHGGELNYSARPEGGARFEMELPWRAC